jgi:hypothetical protein
MRRALRNASLALLALLLCGCPMTGKAPLGRVEDAFVDNALPGRWESMRDEGGKEYFLEIYRFNDREYYLEGGPSSDNGVERMRALVTAIGEARFLNLQDLKGYRPEDSWLYLHYAVGADNVLTLRVLEEGLFLRENKAGRPLADFIRDHLDNGALLGESQRFRKAPPPAN